MKLLSTIAAVLISISAYSQDYVEYNEVGFSMNGEELSMEQIYDLTILHKAGKSNVRRGNKFNEMHKAPIYLRGTNNTLNFLGGAATGFIGGIGVSSSYILMYSDYLTAAAIFIVPSTVLCAVSCAAFSRITFREGCLRKRDKQFNKVADKINQAITGKAPSTQPSNTYIHESFK